MSQLRSHVSEISATRTRRNRAWQRENGNQQKAVSLYECKKWHVQRDNSVYSLRSRPDGVIPPNAPRIDTPEELAAWIAARKKNWPSKDNVDRKEQEMAEKEARGELPVNNNKKRKANDRNKQQNKKSKTEEASLVDAHYDSDSDSDGIMDPERDAISSKDPSAMGKILLPQDRPKRRCKYFMIGKCKRGDACGFSHEKPEARPKQPKNAPVVKKRPNLLFKASVCCVGSARDLTFSSSCWKRTLCRKRASSYSACDTLPTITFSVKEILLVCH